MKYCFSAILVAIVLVSVPTFAQRNVTQAIDRDPVLEKDAKHNLDVAWQAFTPLKRAYKQVIFRFERPTLPILISRRSTNFYILRVCPAITFRRMKVSKRSI
jgi:hypothetical protein